MTKQDRRDIASIVNHFDFALVHQCMVGMRWQWAVRGSRRRRVPSRTRIIASATELLHHAVKMSSGWVSSGGFRAGRDEHGRLALAFEVAACNASELEP